MTRKKTFSCFHCGQCCRLDVILTDADIARLEKAGLKLKDFAELNKFPAYSKYVLKKRQDHYCAYILLDEQHKSRCSIYEHRPEVCRVYPFIQSDIIEDCRPNLELMKTMIEVKELIKKRGFI